MARWPLQMACLTLLSLPAFAQETLPAIDAHGFVPAPMDGDLRDPLTVVRPGAMTGGEWFLGALGEYASAPLVNVTTDGQGLERGRDLLLDNLTVVNLSGGVALHERVRVDASVPVVAVASSLGELGGPTVGDARLRGTALLIAPKPGRTTGGLGLNAHVDLPTGNVDRYLGRKAPAGGAALSGTGEFGLFTLTGELGVQLEPKVGVSNVVGSDALVSGLGLSFLASEQAAIIAEARWSAPFEASAVANTGGGGEASLALRYHHAGGGWMILGGSAGLSESPGTAAFRAFLGGGFGRVTGEAVADADPQGVLQIADRCPAELEVVNGYLDEDGCPDSLGSVRVVANYQGVAQAAELTVVGPEGSRTEALGAEGTMFTALPGTHWDLKATAQGGCLVGQAETTAVEAGNDVRIALSAVRPARVLVEVMSTDGTPVPNAMVVWRSANPGCVPSGSLAAGQGGLLEQDLGAGTHTVSVSAEGYGAAEREVMVAAGDQPVISFALGPTRVRIEKQQIVILDKVFFESGKDTILPASFGLLDEVATTINTVPEAGRIEVAGHTDNKGSDTFNLELSQDRAESVVTYLIGRGVPAARLVAKGYGETTPVDTNRTETGRERNRRVEFNLIDTPAPETTP